MIQKVYCPYCGSEMTVTEPHLYSHKSGIGVLMECHYRCSNCSSGAPWVNGKFESPEECIKAAFSAATKRFDSKTMN